MTNVQARRPEGAGTELATATRKELTMTEDREELLRLVKKAEGGGSPDREACQELAVYLDEHAYDFEGDATALADDLREVLGWDGDLATSHFDWLTDERFRERWQGLPDNLRRLRIGDDDVRDIVRLRGELAADVLLHCVLDRVRRGLNEGERT